MSKDSQTSVDLTEGSIAKGITLFAIPIFLGQLLQQLYNVADAWVVGNFADNNAFAAVASSGTLVFLIVGFFNGLAIGGGVVISHYVGAKDHENLQRAIHTNFLFGILSSVLATVVGLLALPHLLVLMKVPEEVMPESLTYFQIYIAGVTTVIMYNICMAIMRALGDSMSPLYYLTLSSVVNVVLDLVLVAGFHMGVTGAALATVFSQGLSMVLCVIRMCRQTDETKLDFRKLTFQPQMMKAVLRQGLPSGIQNSVISIGNIVVQTNINSFGMYAMSGSGAYSKIEGFVFLPIMSMSLALPTFISQNLGAKNIQRAKKGARFGILSGMLMAEIVGIIFYILCPQGIRLFVDSEQAITFGTIHGRTVCLFFFLLAFSHCAAGILRGCGKSVIPMAAMLAFWCGVRIIYISTILPILPKFQMIAWAYPLTWFLSSVVFVVSLLRLNWEKAHV